MGLFDFFKKKKTENVEQAQDTKVSQNTSETKPNTQDLWDDDMDDMEEEFFAEASKNEKPSEDVRENAESEQTNPAESAVESDKAEETSQSGAEAASAEAAQTEAAPAEAAQTEAAPAEDAPAEAAQTEAAPAEAAPAEAAPAEAAQAGPAQAGQKKPTLTPEQMAEKRAQQEEMTKKRDGEGMVLSYLIQRHHEIRNAESFKSVLESLTTCWLWVPMRMQVSKADALAMEAARKEGRKYTPKDQVRLAPSLIRTKDGQLVFSTYTNRDEIPKDMQKQFIWVQMPSGQCGRNVVANPNISAMVINPTGKSLLLKRELLEKLMKPFRTPEQQAEQDLASQPDTTGFTS